MNETSCFYSSYMDQAYLYYNRFKKTPSKSWGDKQSLSLRLELNLVCHPPLEVTKRNPTSRGGGDVITILCAILSCERNTPCVSSEI